MKIFFDSSVLIASLLSDTGGSAKLLNLCEVKSLSGYISEDVVVEVEIVLNRKFPALLEIFRKNTAETNLIIVKFASSAKLKEASTWIKDPNDAKILAGAKEADVDFLVTLDIRDFIKDTSVSKKSGIKILTPGDMLKELYLSIPNI